MNKFRISLLRKIVFLCIPIFSIQASNAQQVHFIRANSTQVDIRDGDDFQKGIWKISPEVKPDVFNAERFNGKKIVVFYTDRDSISFAVEAGQDYDFGIILKGKDTAFTRISTKKITVLKWEQANSENKYGTDTIPFSLGWKNQIKIRGKINNSDWLDMIFDTGANGISISADALKKNLTLPRDGMITSYGIGGAQQDEFSKNNTLQIAKLKWSAVAVILKHTGKPSTDVVLGYNAFDNKIVEINYERNILVLHNSLPTLDPGFARYDLKFKRGLSFIKLAMFNGTKKIEGLFDFDTGSSESLLLSQSFSKANNLYDAMEIIGSDDIKGSGPHKVSVHHMQLPLLSFGNYSLTNIPVDMEKLSSENSFDNIVGNDVLKRFNAFIDYQNNCVYLKVNSLAGDMYLTRKITYLKRGVIIFVCGILGFLFFRYARKKRRYNIEKFSGLNHSQRIGHIIQ